MRPPPDETPQTRADRLARQEREAAALRDNLRRRKEQTRARALPPASKPEPDDGPSAPIVPRLGAR